MIKNIAILLTCYNRKNTTLHCLENVFLQKIAAHIDVYLCDDASTDGTSDAVKKHFPQVNIIEGNGNLFWNRGMLKAWQAASYSKHLYDAYIWLNDDTILYDGAIQELLDCSSMKKDESIICGAFCDLEKKFSYGGRSMEGNPIIPNGCMQSVYWLNGNCVFIPNVVVNKIGLLDSMFQHHLGDYDYGLRAIEAGICIVSTRKYIGECIPNVIKNTRSRKDGLSVFGRFKRLYSPMGSNPIILFRYTLRHFGLKKALSIFLALHWNNLLSDRIYLWKNNEKI